MEMTPQKNPKGSVLLKIASILMIVGGAAGIVLGILAIGGGIALKNTELADDINFSALVIAGVILIVAGIIQLIAGIFGSKNYNKPEKANVCIVWGIIVAVLCVVSNVITLTSGGKFDAVSLITGLAVPALYIVGAVLNKKND